MNASNCTQRRKFTARLLIYTLRARLEFEDTGSLYVLQKNFEIRVYKLRNYN